MYFIFGETTLGQKIICPYCESKNVRRMKSESRIKCRNCRRSFSVLVGTIFEHTRLPLKTWFQLIFIMVTAKRGISAKYIWRSIGGSYKTAWYAAMRVRCGMVNDCEVLQNIVEMDEVYLGGKPRKRAYRGKNNKPELSQFYNNTKGGMTGKIPVVGIVERNGKIVLNVIEHVNTQSLVGMLKKYVRTDNAVVMTDEHRAYNKFDDIVSHLTVNHSKYEYVRGATHTNTIEGFFAILRNTIKGNYVAISKKYLPLYLVNSAYIYNHRNDRGSMFEAYIKDALTREKPFEYYKPTEDLKKLTQKKCKPAIKRGQYENIQFQESGKKPPRKRRGSIGIKTKIKK